MSEFGNYHIVGYQAVAPQEWNEIANTNQKRLRLAEQTGASLAQAYSEINRIDHAISHSSGELERARTTLRNAGENVHQAPHKSQYYVAVLILLALLEIPVNASALDFLNMQEWESYMLAGFLGIISLIASRGSARILRQSASSAWRDWTIFGVTNLALFLALYGIGQLRGGLVESTTEQIPGLGIGTICFLLQLLLYLAACFFSYLQTPPDFENEQVYKRIKNLRKTLNQQWLIRAKIAAGYNQQLHKVQKLMHALEEECFMRIAQYRDGNMYVRDTSKPAPKFMTVPLTRAIFVPVALGRFVDEHPKSIGEVLVADQ